MAFLLKVRASNDNKWFDGGYAANDEQRPYLVTLAKRFAACGIPAAITDGVNTELFENGVNVPVRIAR